MDWVLEAKKFIWRAQEARDPDEKTAHLKTAEDTAASAYQRMMGRYQHAASLAGQAGSYIRPEIMAIPAAKMKTFLAASPWAIEAGTSASTTSQVTA